MMWLKIKVLFWKSIQIRKRQWKSTVLELILPCILFTIAYYVRTILSNSETFPNQTTVSEEKLFHDFQTNISSETYLIYTPDTSQNTYIMSSVRNRFNISKIYPFESEREMIQKFKNSSEKNRFGIVFEEVNKCNIFKYKIRNTNDDFKNTELMNNGDKYLKTGFIALQLALDKAFIELSINGTSKSISDYNLKIQSYPYTRNLRDLLLQSKYQTYFSFLIFFSFLYLFSSIIKSVTEEKHSGVREHMKMMGVKSWMILTGWVLHNSPIYITSITVITFLTCFELNTGKGQLLNYFSPLLFWIILTIYMIAIHCFAFAFCSFFNQPLIALKVGSTVWSLSFMVPTVLNIYYPTASIAIQSLFILLPNVALFNVFTTFSSLESQGIELQFSTLFTTVKGGSNFSVGFVLIMFIIQCILYGFIAWYMDSVMPGKYGIAKPVNFFCKWSNNNTEENEMAPIYKINNRFFEKPPNGYEAGIRIQNLYKRFGGCNAVSGVNLDLYKGQITALLGHNGAGKTTTMSIITGLFSPTSGSVIVNGNDIFNNTDKFREHLGVCPQHNLLFSSLSTLDHLIFFGMLKGMTLKKAQLEGLELLKLLNILQKKNELVSALSGGMKRKLSLAIALVGSPDIIILDEPTSGMDPESRRKIWDLLLSLRGSRTILITTHFMEEADVLGDRIAIMDHGQVKCYGTSLFLKKAYGTGYNLTIVKEELCKESDLLAAIKQIIPEAKIKSSMTAQMVINLPNEHTNKFSDVFRLLETNKKRLCIKGMGISCITMEEVFLRAEKNVIADNDELLSCKTTVDADRFHSRTDLDDISEHKFLFNSDDTQTLELTSGLYLLKNQFKILMEKKIVISYRNWLQTLVFMLFPIIMFIYPMVFTGNASNTSSNSDIPQELNISLSIYEDSSVYYRVANESFENLESRFITISEKNLATVHKISPKNNITTELLKLCNDNVLKYKTNLMIAGDFDGTNTTVIYNNISAHTPAIAINLYSNALLQKLTGKNESYISTVNEPIQLQNKNNSSETFSNQSEKSMLLTFMLGLLYLFGYFIGLPLKERVNGFKHIQMMTKLSPAMYWTTNFLWDYFCYTVVIMFTFITEYKFDVYHLFNNFHELIVILTLFFIYGWSAIIYTYVYSFFKKTHASAFLLYILVNVILGPLGMIGFIIDTVEFLDDTNILNILTVFRYVILMIPHSSFMASFLGIHQISRENQKSGSVNFTSKGFFEFKSAENKHGILEESLILFFSGILYIIVILLFDYKMFHRVYQYGFNSIYGTDIGTIEYDEDQDVIDEKNKVEAAKTRPYDTVCPLLLVDDLVKKFSFKFTGVRGISFTVAPGECFGLLGVNGAGKTTTFRILTGDTFPSRGDASIQTDKLYKLSSNLNKYVSIIGYCPQSDAFNDKFTGKELLKLMAILRGISSTNANKHVDKWIKLLGLDEYKDKISGDYSGGNKRKLNTAMALIGDPPIVFLDEPTSGVDPVARRNLWQVLTARKKSGQAIVLTSHSMDECEALCDRLTIMVDGVMKCVGSIQYLKNRYGQGFTIMIKLSDADTDAVAKLKADVEVKFAPDINLKDEHRGLLHYHITDPLIPSSKIFDQMETIKQNYSVVEDYTISDTTLEQVFIAFAKRQAMLNTKPE